MKETTHEIDLINRLTKIEVEKLQMAIDLPARLSEKWKKPEDFILNLNTWEDYDPDFFLKTLKLVNPFLAAIAEEIPYLTAQPTVIEEIDKMRRDIRKFVAILRDGITIKEWKIILKSYNYNIEEAFDFKKASKFFIQNDIIQKNLKNLITNLKKVKREDLVQKMQIYRKQFQLLTNYQFINYFKEEASIEDLLIFIIK